MTTIIQQKQETKTQRFVLVGPHVGKTLNVNGHPFVDGEYIFQGPAHQIESLAKIFKRYAALPIEQAQAYQIEYIKANGSDEDKAKVAQFEQSQELSKALDLKPEGEDTGDKGGEQTGEQANQASSDAPGSQAPASDASTGTGSQAHDPNPPQDPQKPTLAEAIGLLDPEVDAHWTSNNLPSLDILSEQVGKKVGRADVDAVAEGYTRAKARAAKQA